MAIVELISSWVMSYPGWMLLTTVLVMCVALALRLYNGGDSGPRTNPFRKDSRRPREPVLVEAKARDQILKQRFKPSKVAGDLDVVVVGSGAGGLTAALLLARSGKKVLVLEQHDQAGGCCHTFVEKGYEFDTGIHYVGNMDNTQGRLLLDQLTCGQLDWAPMDDQFDEVAIGDLEQVRRYGMRSGRQRYVDNLINLFPGEEQAIRKYEQLVSHADGSFLGTVILRVLPRLLVTVLLKTGLYRLFFSCFKYSTVTLQQTLDGLTDNEDLKTVLSYLFGDYGVLPKDVPFLMHAVVVRYYWDGAFYPVGGPSEIALQLTRALDQAGGSVLVQAPVSSVLCDAAGRAVGVRVARSSGDVDVFARTVVSGAGVRNTFHSLLPREVAAKSCMYPMVDGVGPGLSFMTTFIGLDSGQDELKLPSGNTWYFASNDANRVTSDYLSLPVEELARAPVPVCYVSFPSAKDPLWRVRHPDKSSALIITLASWQWFESWQNGRLRHRGTEYDVIKDGIGDGMWNVCRSLFPQCEGKKDYMEVGTPVTNKHYLGAPSGEMYGLNQDRARFTPEAIATLRCDTDIPGLYLTGQDLLSGGFESAMYAGVICASKMLNRNLLNDFKRLQRSLSTKTSARPS